MADPQTFAITGIPYDSSKPVPTRQEISKWVDNDANKYQVSLFLRALTSFMETDINERLSYFQIAGIHCYPKQMWDGERAPSRVSTDPFDGFCSHNRVTFPTWHRPYMLLYEQVIWMHMNSIIDDWVTKGILKDPKEQNVWRDAANQFRLPYWDWAAHSRIPQVFVQESVPVVKPASRDNEDFPNPLVKFRNPTRDSQGKSVPMGDKQAMGKYAIEQNDPNDPKKPRDPPYNVLPWDKCVATSRFGIELNGPDWVDGINNVDRCNLALSNPGFPGGFANSLSDAVCRILSKDYFKYWEYFASTKWKATTKPDNKGFGSLEYVHNIVHNMTGGQFMADSDIDKGRTGYLGLGLGHMSDVPVAAFDPIFWLHHCNIDRICAIWQALNWEKWFDHPNPGTGPIDPTPDDTLLPFHFAEGSPGSHLYTSNRTRKCKDLGYQYDDLVPGTGVTEGSEEYLRDLRKRIDGLYPDTGSILRDIDGYKQGYNDYLIQVVYDRAALNGFAYSILFFIGEPPETLSDYRSSPNFVGSVYTFSSPVEDADGNVACDNCASQRDEGVLSSASIPITLQLFEHSARRLYPDAPPDGSSGLIQVPVGADPGALGRLLDRTVAASVLDHHESPGLNWEFVALGGQRLPKEMFPKTTVAVVAGEATQGGAGLGDGFMGGDGGGDALPVYGRYDILLDTRKQKLFFGPGPSQSLVANPDNFAEGWITDDP